MFISVAVGDDITYMVLQGLQGRQELQQRLLVKQRGARNVHDDGVLCVHAGHAHCGILEDGQKEVKDEAAETSHTEISEEALRSFTHVKVLIPH